MMGVANILGGAFSAIHGVTVENTAPYEDGEQAKHIQRIPIRPRRRKLLNGYRQSFLVIKSLDAFSNSVAPFLYFFVPRYGKPDL